MKEFIHTSHHMMHPRQMGSGEKCVSIDDILQKQHEPILFLPILIPESANIYGPHTCLTQRAFQKSRIGHMKKDQQTFCYESNLYANFH